MSIEIRDYNGIHGIVSFGPDAIRLGRKTYPYDEMEELPIIEKDRRRSWTGYVMRFKPRGRMRKTLQVYESDIPAIERATSAIRARAYAGYPPRALEDGVDGRALAKLQPLPSKTRIQEMRHEAIATSPQSQVNWGEVGIKLLKMLGKVLIVVVMFPFALIVGALSAQEKSQRRRR